ncbi:MAG: hypothetical protein KDJ67_16635 [Nitratireductor sp.]|nr:hypothetical protein [Nitratireductor sp.]
MSAKNETRSVIGRFRSDAKGGATVQTALLFGAVALGMAVLAAPMLQDAAHYYAENRALGIDKVITGAVGDAATNKYRVRRSVMSDEAEIICNGRISADCVKSGN